MPRHQGADGVFVDALRSVEDMRALCAAVPAHVPKMANMLEGGATPICTPAQLQDMGCAASKHACTEHI